MNSLCADSKAVNAAASSNVGCGGGGNGFFTTGRRIGFAVTRRVGALVAGLGVALTRDFAAGFAAARFVVAFLLDVTFVALFARALPAGERLVAGFSVDLATRFRAPAPLAAERAVERDGSLFSGLLIVTCAEPLKVPKRRLLRGGA